MSDPVERVAGVVSEQPGTMDAGDLGSPVAAYFQDAEKSSANETAARRALLRGAVPIPAVDAAAELDRMIEDLEQRAVDRGTRLTRDERRLVARLRARLREALESIVNDYTKD